MHSKSKKVASRQAELGNRKRRASKHPAADRSPINVVTKGRTPTLSTYHTVNTSASVQHQPIVHDRDVNQEMQTVASDHPKQNLEIMSELKRIGVTTSVLLIVLGALTTILR